MRRKLSPGKLAFLSLLVVFVGALLVVRGVVFGVKSVEIRGVTRFGKEQIMELASIRYHDSVLMLDKSRVEQGINANVYLRFVRMESSLDGTVVLYIDERVPCANIVVGQEQYILDEEGMVLSAQTVQRLDNGLITITGMVPRSMFVGSHMVCQNSAQLFAYSAVIKEIRAQRCEGDVAEICLANLENIQYVTTDGFVVRLGTAGDLRVKIGTARGLVAYQRNLAAELSARGESSFKLGGTIETSVPKFATFTPPQS